PGMIYALDQHDPHYLVASDDEDLHLISVFNPALKYIPHMLVGALAARQLIEDRPVDQAFLIDYVDSVVLPALGV
ncbi:ectoine synthase, partial [Streptomyces rubiginosohelvolus]